MTHSPFYHAALAVGFGMAGQVLASRLRVPSIILLLVVGVAIGPDGLGLLNPDVFGSARTDLVTLAVTMVLFEGGLGLRWEDLRQQQRSLTRLLTLGAAISMLGGSAAAHYVLAMPWSIACVYDKWIPAIVPTSLISIALAITALGYVPGVLYNAISRPDILNKLAIAKMPVAFLILWYSTRWGIVGVAAGQIVIALISVSLDMMIANHVMRYPLSELYNAISPSLVSTLSMAVVLFLVHQAVPSEGLVQLVLMVALGGLTYFGVFWLLNRDALYLGVTTIRSALLRKKTSRKTVMEVASDD